MTPVLKATLRKAISRAGLTEPAFKARERVRALRAGGGRSLGSDGLPLPPPVMMVRVVGHADADAFERHGQACAELVRTLVSEQGAELESMDAILDFGCGCGRVLRQWHDLAGPRVCGSDYNAELVAWCQENLPFADTQTNGSRPPLQLGDSEFDLIYAFSVFTHLTEPAQHAWMAELRRVLRPGGLLLFTTKGTSHAEQQLDPDLLARYRSGEFVATAVDAEGTNLCAAYTPRAWVEQNLLGELDLVHHHPGTPAVMDSQEIYLVSGPRARASARRDAP
jgi:SAM-dependent methyltransferase